MDRIQELLTRLADLSDAEIAELEGLILAEFDSVQAEEPTNVSVERMVSLADALDTVRSEVTNRNDQAEELAQRAAEATARVRADAETSDDTPDASEMGMKDEEEEDDELPSEDKIAEDIEQVTEDVVDAVEDAEAAGEENEAEKEDEEEDEDKFSDSTPASAELSVGTDTDEAPAEAAADAELTESDDETTEAPAEAEVEAAAELSEDSEPETGNSTSTTELSDDSAEQSETPIDSSEQENAMTASIDQGDGVVVTPPADAAPVPSALVASGTLDIAITAGADIPSYGSGAELSDMDQVADAFAKRLHTLRNVQGGSGSQFTIATLSYEFPEDRVLAGDDPSNITKVNKVISPAALTAAAGVCAPLETIYDVSVCGDADRPIRDSLARFNADRGGIEYFGAPTLGTCTGIWDSTAPAAKSCCDANCPTKQTVNLEAIYACMKFSNYTNRFFPEVIKANTDLAMINHARQAELNLMSKIYKAAASSLVVPSTPLKGVSAKTLVAGGVGVTRAFIVAVHSAAAYLRRKHRLSDRATMRVILPNWVQDAMVADLALQMPGDGTEVLNTGTRRLNQILDSLGVKVTWSLDNWTKTGTAAAAPTVASGGFDALVSFPIFPEGTFLFLDGGTLDLGVQRDATMMTANEYATFVESFEGLAMTGCEALWVSDLPVCVSGAAAALVDTTC